MDETWENLTIRIKRKELKAKLVQTETAGRGLVATQDLSKNQTHCLLRILMGKRQIFDCTLTSLLIGCQLSRDHVETGL